MVHLMKLSTSELFSSQHKNIDSKFISEAAIPESDKIDEVVVAERIDTRPLHVRLAEQRHKEEDDMDELFKLKNRVRKLDEDEVEFYAKLHSEDQQRQRIIRKKETEELDRFRADSESLAIKLDERQAGDTDRKRERDGSRDAMAGAVRLTKKKKAVEPLVSYADSD